ncbi:MAG: hypothetical protein F6K55_07555 [Moorea sp. SIO4A3]|nr:hypothetical protein [Moorena sp. SIO4A3]
MCWYFPPGGGLGNREQGTGKSEEITNNKSCVAVPVAHKLIADSRDFGQIYLTILEGSIRLKTAIVKDS